MPERTKIRNLKIHRSQAGAGRLFTLLSRNKSPSKDRHLGISQPTSHENVGLLHNPACTLHAAFQLLFLCTSVKAESQIGAWCESVTTAGLVCGKAQW